MRHRKQEKKLHRNKPARISLMRNLAVSLIMKEKITTTKGKAVAVRPFVEKLITISKHKDINTKRRLQHLLNNKPATAKLKKTLSTRFQERKGGYCRLIPIGRRQGDNAEQVIIELV